MERHCSNALAVGRFLQDHPKAAWVNYPGLENIPPDLARLSVGLETLDDILWDLDRELAKS